MELCDTIDRLRGIERKRAYFWKGVFHRKPKTTERIAKKINSAKKIKTKQVRVVIISTLVVELICVKRTSSVQSG